MTRALLILLALSGCAGAPAPKAPEPCRIRPLTVTSRDFFTAETRREMRRVNRELRQQCAG